MKENRKDIRKMKQTDKTDIIQLSGNVFQIYRRLLGSHLREVILREVNMKGMLRICRAAAEASTACIYPDCGRLLCIIQI